MDKIIVVHIIMARIQRRRDIKLVMLCICWLVRQYIGQYVGLP